eukprot:TRINITY_DN41684_c0_g1_i7.p5 TRINITY_DN41684_c0_g1~~TRINITY_DN41684_c0_g1_i7.p5  ORF type:complete len:105 (+),score=26.05 TRINITY_DN41684_c0_g1_i7:461-775(+)
MNIENVVTEMRKFMGEEWGFEASEPRVRYLPSQVELNGAGRSDLRYAVQLHGSWAIADRMGLKVRGRKKKRKTKDKSKVEQEVLVDEFLLVDDKNVNLEKGSLI